MIAALLSFLRPREIEPLPVHEQVRIGRIQLARIHCPVCGRPLDEEEMVVWRERIPGERSALAHAACVVLIRRSDGITTKLRGEVVPTGPDGGILEPLPLAILLTEAEWIAWSEQWSYVYPTKES